VVNARFMADVQSEQLEQQRRIEALQFENERLRCVKQRRERLVASLHRFSLAALVADENA
jgi:hypothetical protein